MAYLDENGLLYFWGKVKARITASVPTKTSQLTNDSGFATTSAIPAASANAPKMDGTAAIGSSAKYAREDHVHPTDTSRAAASALTSHTGNSTVHITAAERANWNSAYNRTQQLGSALSYKGSCAYADLPASPATGDTWNVTDAHGNVPAGTNWAWNGEAWDALGGDVDLSAYATTGAVNTALAKKQDKLAAGANITINGSTISAHDTTYGAATASVGGLMSAADKSKLDGIAAGANSYSLPAATSSVLGGVKTGANITNSSGTISLTKANVASALGYTPPTHDTTYADMSGATSSAAGAHGLVPAPAAGKQSSYLRGDGTWAVPHDTTYVDMAAVKDSDGKVTGVSEGLVPAYSTSAPMSVDYGGGAVYLSSTGWREAGAIRNDAMNLVTGAAVFNTLQVNLAKKQDKMSAITNSSIDTICAS